MRRPHRFLPRKTRRTRRKHWDEFGIQEVRKDFAGRGSFHGFLISKLNPIFETLIFSREKRERSRKWILAACPSIFLPFLALFRVFRGPSAFSRRMEIAK